MLYRTIAHLLCLSLIFAGCATRQMKLDDQRAVTGCKEVLVRQIEYDRKGLPLFLHQLVKRPSRAGDQFTIAQLMNGRPTTSYDIVVAGTDNDFTKPFKVVYEWTGSGFQWGARNTLVTGNMVSYGGTMGRGRDEHGVTLAFVIAPMVIGTAGGFIIGVADGIRTTAEEVGKVVVGKQEQVVAYTTYAYDARDRLALTRMYKANDSRQELVRTEYIYLADSPEPLKTTITTYPDGAVRIVE